MLQQTWMLQCRLLYNQTPILSLFHLLSEIPLYSTSSSNADPLNQVHHCDSILGTLPKKKNGKRWEFFPSGGPPPPPPCLGMTRLWKKNMVYFAFQDLRNIFGFHKNVHFWGAIMVCRSGHGWHPHPLKWKIPTLSRFLWFFLQNEHSGTQNKINLKWSNWSDNTSPLL